MSSSASCHGRGPILRRLEHKDIAKIKDLCSDCFPIEYSDHWFDYVTSAKVSSRIMRCESYYSAIAGFLSWFLLTQ